MAKAARAKRSRIAVVDLPGLALQLLCRRRPRWRGLAVAVVTEDRPDAIVTQLNDAARRAGLATGTRYGAARGLVPELRGGVVSEAELDAAVAELTTGLQTFSPRVEPDPDRPGVFYVDPSGLSRIYGGVGSWARAVHAYLKGRGFAGAVVVGYGRFATLAVARTCTGARVLRSAAATRRAAEEVPLPTLGISPDLRDGLAALGVHTLGDLAGLPSGDLCSRFGPEAAALADRMADDPKLPMQPRGFEEPVRIETEVEPPDADHTRLLFAIKGALHGLITEVVRRGEAVVALRVELGLERGAPHRERIEPARATRGAMLLVDLVRLRLADVELAAPVERITLEAESVRAEGDQLALFRVGRQRDLHKGARALARVRAAFGVGAVTKAQLRDAHLPEATFEWAPLSAPVRPKAEPATSTDGPPPLVRRVLARPVPLSDDVATDGTLRLFGPYRVSGGWWVRTVERDYYYAETAGGELLWLFYDRPRGRWYQHGLVD